MSKVFWSTHGKMLERSIPKQPGMLVQVRQIVMLPSRKWMRAGRLLHVLCLHEDLKYIIWQLVLRSLGPEKPPPPARGADRRLGVSLQKNSQP